MVNANSGGGRFVPNRGDNFIGRRVDQVHVVHLRHKGHRLSRRGADVGRAARADIDAGDLKMDHGFRAHRLEHIDRKRKLGAVDIMAPLGDVLGPQPENEARGRDMGR